MHNTKNILFAEDHCLVSYAMHYLISHNFPGCVVSKVSSIKDMQLQLLTGNYTHLLLDLNLEDGIAMDKLPELIEQYPHLKILIHSMAPQEVDVKKIWKLHTSGFLRKGADEEEILRALDIFLYDEVYAVCY